MATRKNDILQETLALLVLKDARTRGELYSRHFFTPLDTREKTRC